MMTEYEDNHPAFLTESTALTSFIFDRPVKSHKSGDLQMAL